MRREERGEPTTTTTKKACVCENQGESTATALSCLFQAGRHGAGMLQAAAKALPTGQGHHPPLKTATACPCLLHPGKGNNKGRLGGGSWVVGGRVGMSACGR